MNNLIPHYIQEQFLQGKTHGSLMAYTMFVDLSGFTSLTETLMKQGNDGAEHLSIILNDIFAPMVSLVYDKKGFIPYFAGDSFNAVFEDHATAINFDSIIETAQLLRAYFTERGLKETPFGNFQIGIKIGISFGLVEWGIIGDDHKSFYFRGAAIDQSADAQSIADQQEIILDRSFLDQVKEYEHIQKITNQHFKLELPLSKKLEIPATTKTITLQEEVVQQFLPNSVINFNQIGEFRDIISVFISFRGINDHESMNRFGTIVLEEINNFSGYFKEVDFGDKGGVIVGFFGAPVSFENNIERGLEFITAVGEAIHEFSEEEAIQFRAGITSGLSYMGIVGGKERCQYAAVGNYVNIAARLMIKADWGEVLTDSDIQKSKQFTFSHKGNIQYKGIEVDIPTYKLEGRNQNYMPEFSGKIIGRDKELQQLQEHINPIFDQKFAGIVYLYGEAGIGKSRLSFELKQRLKKEGTLKWYTCQADQILRKSFNPFIYWLKNHFNQSTENSSAKNQKKFEKSYSKLLSNIEKNPSKDHLEIIKELKRTKSVLAALVGIIYSDTLWEQLNAKGRYQNTIDAIINLLMATALNNPLVIELEDGHWYDNDSKALLKELIKKIKKYPVAILITSRYHDDGTKPSLIENDLLTTNDITSLVIDLNILQTDSMRAFAEGKLEGKIDQELLELLMRTTNGNPFYGEQILEYFIESNLLKQVSGQWHIKDKSIKLSGSINAILMARIDRLSTLVKETVKAAAVIGREFEVPILTEVMKSHEEFIKRNGNSIAVLKEQISSAEEVQIWRAMNELTYIFKHSLLREAVYEMQLKTHLRHLHQLIGESIEKLYPDVIEEKYVDLAFHFEQAQILDKTNEYFKKAADFSRRNFQNAAALRYYDKLLSNLEHQKDKSQYINILLKKATVLELIGEWDKCEKLYTQALDLARQTDDKILIGRCNNHLGNLLLLKGNYESARRYLEVAATFFELSEDQKGISIAYGNLGNLFFRQGQYEDAKSYFTKSIKLNQSSGTGTISAQIVANLGLTHMNQGNFEEGIRCQQEQLVICEKIGDKQGMATLNTNMGIVYSEKGDYDDALVCYQKGLALSEELGNKLLKSIAIGCIGTVYQEKGNYTEAMANFELDLQIGEELGDKQGMAIALGLIGELQAIQGKFELAIKNLERSLYLCESLNYQKGIAKAENILGDIHHLKKNYEASIKCYNKAIDVTRAINSRLVLGYSLVEKGNTLIHFQKYDEAHSIYLEALEIAENLGNPNLIFQAVILSAQVAYHTGLEEIADKTLTDLIKQANSDADKANVHYELSKMSSEKISHQKQALALYKKLYQETPKYIYQQRIEELTPLNP